MHSAFIGIIWVLVLVASSSPVSAQRFTEKQISREPLLANPQVASMKLSPDGKHVAGMGYSKQGMSAAFVIEVDTGAKRLIAAPESDRRYVFGQVPVAVHWVANDLLAIDYNNRESVSVDLWGKKVAQLGERFIRRMPEKGAQSEFVLVYRDVEDREFDLVHARTGERRIFRISLPGKPMAWAFDASGALLAVTMVESARWIGQSKISNWYRATEQDAWKLLEELPVTSRDQWFPLLAQPESHSLVIRSRRDRDTYAVFKYDTVSRQHVELMAGHPREDISHAQGLDSPTFESVLTDGIKPSIFWFDPRWAALQATVDGALPGRINYLQGTKQGRVLVSSFGDVDPGRWFILDTQTASMWELAESMPDIRPETQRPMETMRYLARDGLPVAAYLTRPAGESSQPAPMVVLIHGGPNVRDRWGWDEEVQLLAKAGYLVFQPQFRGSTGFGRKFEEAGYRQWGRAMQDDITDGVRHLIEQKVADPSRICISGASYGGYAALWGTIATPELFKCGISFAGVSDLHDMLVSGIFDDSTPISRELARDRIGDPDKDQQALDAVSPLKHANRVGAPLLIAHGDLDRRVLLSQSKNMVTALEVAQRPVDWMRFDGEGHGLGWIKNRVRYFTAVLNFLDHHIGPGTPPVAPASVTGGKE